MSVSTNPRTLLRRQSYTVGGPDSSEGGAWTGPLGSSNHLVVPPSSSIHRGRHTDTEGYFTPDLFALG